MPSQTLSCWFAKGSANLEQLVTHSFFSLILSDTGHHLPVKSTEEKLEGESCGKEAGPAPSTSFSAVTPGKETPRQWEPPSHLGPYSASPFSLHLGRDFWIVEKRCLV